jgi:plasmid stability protein
MRAVTIRNLSDEAKLELRKQAAARGISMEQHLRDLVQAATHTQAKQKPSGTASVAAIELADVTGPADRSYNGRAISRPISRSI